jgi:tetratricopeptide (TPR) repeat protein
MIVGIIAAVALPRLAADKAEAQEARIHQLEVGKQYNKAIRLRKERLKEDAGNYIHYYHIGNDYYHIKQYQEAISFYKQGLTIAPDYFWFYINIGDAYKELDDNTQAITYFEKSIKVAPERPEGYNNLATVYKSQKKYQKAMALLDQAIKHNPEYLDPYYNRISILSLSGHYAEALDAAEVLYKRTSDPKLHKRMASIYSRQKQYTKAADSYHTYLKTNPNDTIAYVDMMELDLVQNRPFDTALLAQFLALKPDNMSRRYYDMILLLQSIAQGEAGDIDGWIKRYGAEKGRWNYILMEKWAAEFKNPEVSQKLKAAITRLKSYSKDY